MGKTGQYRILVKMPFIVKSKMLRYIWKPNSTDQLWRWYLTNSVAILNLSWTKVQYCHYKRQRLMFPFVLPDNPQILIISQNIGGQLQIHTDWPTPLRQGVWILIIYLHLNPHLLVHKMHKRMPQYMEDCDSKWNVLCVVQMCKMDGPINHNKKTASLSGTNGVFFVKLWDCLIWLQHDP